MKHLKRQLNVIKAIPHLNKKQYRALIQNGDKELLHCLSHIIDNAASGRLKLSKTTINKLRKYRSSINKLRQPKLPYAQRKKILTQSGSGLLTVLLPTVLGSLVHLVRKIFKK